MVRGEDRSRNRAVSTKGLESKSPREEVNLCLKRLLQHAQTTFGHGEAQNRQNSRSGQIHAQKPLQSLQEQCIQVSSQRLSQGRRKKTPEVDPAGVDVDSKQNQGHVEGFSVRTQSFDEDLQHSHSPFSVTKDVSEESANVGGRAKWVGLDHVSSRGVEGKTADFESGSSEASGRNQGGEGGRKLGQIRSPHRRFVSIQGEAKIAQGLRPVQKSMASPVSRGAYDAIVKRTHTYTNLLVSADSHRLSCTFLAKQIAFLRNSAVYCECLPFSVFSPLRLSP